jgi:hypothetical protein
VKEGLTSGELQRQHAVSIIHQHVLSIDFMAVVYKYSGDSWSGGQVLGLGTECITFTPSLQEIKSAFQHFPREQ